MSSENDGKFIPQKATNGGPLYRGHSFTAAWTALGPGDEQLQRGASARGGVWLLIGEPGVGKTALAEELLLAWRASGAAALVRDCSLAFEELAELLLERLSPEYHHQAKSSAEPAVDHLESFLLDEAQAKRSVTLLFDDAEHLPEDTLEWLALLFEAQHGAGNSLRIILSATPDFRERLAGSWFASLRRYMGLPIGLTPLQQEEVEPYLKHRARHSKGPRLRSISTLAVKRFYELSRGRFGLLNDLFDQAWSQAQLNAVDRITLVQLEPEASGDLDHDEDFLASELGMEDPLEDPGRTDSPAWVMDQAIWDALERDQKPLPPQSSGRVGFRARQTQGQSGYNYGPSLAGLEAIEPAASHRGAEKSGGSAAYAFSPDYDLLDDGATPDGMNPDQMDRVELGLADLANLQGDAGRQAGRAEEQARLPDSKPSIDEKRSAAETQQGRSTGSSHLYPVETPPDFQQAPRRQRPSSAPHLRVLSGDQDEAPPEKQEAAAERTGDDDEPLPASSDETSSAESAVEGIYESALQKEAEAAQSSLTWLEICARSEINEIKARQDLASKSVVSRVMVTPAAAAALDEGERPAAETPDAKAGGGIGNIAVFLGSFFGALLVISALIVFWPSGEPEQARVVPAAIPADRAINMKAFAAWHRPSVAAERALDDPLAYQPPRLTKYGYALPRRKPLAEPEEPTGKPAGPGEPGSIDSSSNLSQQKNAQGGATAVPAEGLGGVQEAQAAEGNRDQVERAQDAESVSSAGALPRPSPHPEALSVVAAAPAEALSTAAAKILAAAESPTLADPVAELESQAATHPVALDDVALAVVAPDIARVKVGNLRQLAALPDDGTVDPQGSTESLVAFSGSADDFDGAVQNLAQPEEISPAPPRAKPLAPAASTEAAAIDRQVRALLARAASSEESRRLTQPAEDSAVDLYRQVLALDPSNRIASESIERIHGQFLIWAGYAENEGNFDRAARHLRKALWIAPDDEVTAKRLDAVQERLRAEAILAGFEKPTAGQGPDGDPVTAGQELTSAQEASSPGESEEAQSAATVNVQDSNQVSPSKPKRRARRDLSIDINGDQVVALIETGNVPAVSLLLEAGAPVNEPDSFGTAPLFYGISYGNPNMVALLLDWGADIGLRNTSGETPLMVSARLGQAAIVELLLQAGADPNERSAAGWTALLLSAARGYVDVTEALLDAGAEVNHADPAGKTALSESAANGEVGTVAALIAAGADVNIRDADGMTPLMLAAWRGHAKTVRILLAADADSAIRSRDGRTAATLAAEKGYGEIATLITPEL